MTMVPLDAIFPNPEAEEFRAIRGELARLYILHAVDLGIAQLTDDEIVATVSNITAALIGCSQVALRDGDTAWLERHRWLGEAFERLMKDQPAVPLDG